MIETSKTNERRWTTLSRHRTAYLNQREGQVITVLALVIGVLTGLAVVAFILLTERLGMDCTLSAVQRGVAACAHPCAGLAGRGILACSLFPEGAGQWRTPNQSSVVRP
jgi:hypothetical protein